jgi:hypothetical protein
MFLRNKWLSPDGDGSGADTSVTDAAQGNGGQGGQGTSDPRIKQLSDENAAWRNKHKLATDEATKLKGQLDEVMTKLSASEAQFGVEKMLLEAAVNAKLNNPGDALKFVDTAAILKLDPDKREAAIAEALGKLVGEKPYLVQGAATQGTDKKQSTTSAANSADDKPTLTLEQIKSMSREELAARKDEVFRVLAKN